MLDGGSLLRIFFIKPVSPAALMKVD